MRRIHSLAAFILLCLSWATGQQCNVPGECVGDLVGISYVSSASLCLGECKDAESSGCAWFTFNGEGDFCGLFATCEINSDSCPQCVSG